MDFKDLVKQFSERILRLKDNLQTEEATKTALILPFLQILGYDVFNPMEVVPEFVCDIGTKKGEKIDYAIIKDGNPCILIECKHWSQELTLHDNQMLRYFHVSNARFGILTNGIQYKFYTDIDKANIMDQSPFLDINLLEIKDAQVEELKKFHKSYFDEDKIYYGAIELKFVSEIKYSLIKEYNAPTEPFVKLFSKRVYDGVISAKMLEVFTGYTKKAFTSFVSDLITERFNSAIKIENEEIEKSEQQPSENFATVSEPKVVTTQTELEAFYIVKAIVSGVIDPNRIGYRDAQTYFSVIVDDTNRKLICRLYLNGKKKYLAVFDDAKKEIKHEILELNDIFKFRDELIFCSNQLI